MTKIIPHETIVNHIYQFRSHKVMLDRDLAILYNVETRVLIQAVKRNIDRFPDDFMFRLNEKEFLRLKSQIVTSKRGGTRKLPYAFTEQGVAMLSGVLNSKRAILVNIEIMRTFVKLRKILAENKDILKKLAELEKKAAKHDLQIKIIFDAIKDLMLPPKDFKPTIGFKVK